MNRSTFSLIKSLFLCFLVFVCLTAGAYESNVITGVKVEGNRLIEEKIILLNLSIKAGDKLEPDKIQEDIARIGEMGYFSYVGAEIRPAKLSSRSKKTPSSAKSKSKVLPRFLSLF